MPASWPRWYHNSDLDYASRRTETMKAELSAAFIVICTGKNDEWISNELCPSGPKTAENTFTTHGCMMHDRYRSWTRETATTWIVIDWSSSSCQWATTNAPKGFTGTLRIHLTAEFNANIERWKTVNLILHTRINASWLSEFSLPKLCTRFFNNKKKRMLCVQWYIHDINWKER